MNVKFTGERLIPNLPELIFLYQEHIVRYLFASQLVKSKVVLDAACGTGYGSSLLLDKGAKKVIGVDISEDAINYCNQNYKKVNLEFKIDDCTKLHFNDHYFDVVVSFETIEHLKEPTSFLSETQRILKKNGILVISTPNRLTYQGSNPFHIKEYDEEEFRNLLGEYFSYVEIFYQSYPSSLAIYKPGKNNAITEVDIPDFRINNHDSAMYFVAVCSNKIPKNYTNKLYLFNEKTILQEEYSTLKKRTTTLENNLKAKEMEISRLESEIHHSSNPENLSALHDLYKKQIDELQRLLDDANRRIDNLYNSFKGNTLRTHAEETLDKLYREILVRSPDELAIKHFLPRLINKEMSEQDLRKILLESEEAKTLEK